ncbi:hypothetical protein MKY80_17265 [Lysinibacillus sp. FSL R5-0849]|uniref:hypothetical protein n=1 Tax=Lysinibacillus sp. FSL R5-0849 TaxID=2921660 RepID=UPI00315B0193
MFKVTVNVAVDAELIPRNRFTKVVINDEEREEPNVLNIQQLNRLLEIAELAEPLTSYAIRVWSSGILLEDGEQLKESGSHTKEPYADNCLFYAFKRLSEKMGI